MRQRVGDKKRRELETKLGRPIRSVWSRGGRSPRYWDVYFGTDQDDEGEVGYWFPEQRQKVVGGKKIDYPERLVMSDVKWRGTL